MQKEEFINQTLKSLEGIKRAEANDFIYTRVIAGIEKREAKGTPLLKPKFAVFALCCLSLLVVLNVIFLLKENSSSEKKINVVSQIRSEYFSYANYNY